VTIDITYQERIPTTGHPADQDPSIRAKRVDQEKILQLQTLNTLRNYLGRTMDLTVGNFNFEN
jgi:hypothetical protein